MPVKIRRSLTSAHRFMDALLLFYSQRPYDDFEPSRVAEIFLELTALTHQLLSRLPDDPAVLNPILYHWDLNNRDIINGQGCQSFCYLGLAGERKHARSYLTLQN